MKSTELFKKFVDQEFGGSRVAVARALGMNKSMAVRLYNGDRNVSPAVALRIEKITKRRFRKEAFIWPESTPEAA